MGERQGSFFSPEFNRSIQVEARPERLSTDTGSLLLRELMERLGYTASFRKHLTDARDPNRVTHSFSELLRTSLLLLAQGWSDQLDVEQLRDDPILRLAVSGRRGQRPLHESGTREPDGLCSQPTLSRLHETLSLEQNREGLGAVLCETGLLRQGLRPGVRLDEMTLDLDSLPQEVHGHQPGSAWNGHYGVRCYHPLVLRSGLGDFLAARLRPGNAHTAEGGLDFVLPILRLMKAYAERLWLRIDAGFPGPELLQGLDREGILYVARLKTNAALERLAAPFLTRPAGRPPAEGRIWTQELQYRAGRWSEARRVVLVVVERSDEQAHLFLDHFFLLTNASIDEMPGANLLEHYRQRGNAEKDLGEWNHSLGLRLSSTPRPKSHYQGRAVTGAYTEPDSFAANEARLLLSLIAANLMHAGAALLDREVTARTSRERFRQLVLKCAGRVLLSGHRVIVVIEAMRAPLWKRLIDEMDLLFPARGSPRVEALPSPA